MYIFMYIYMCVCVLISQDCNMVGGISRFPLGFIHTSFHAICKENIFSQNDQQDEDIARFDKLGVSTKMAVD